MIDRRRAITAGLVAGLAPLAAQAYAQTQAPASAPQTVDSITGLLVAQASKDRLRLDYDGGRFSGPAWDLLLREGATAQFFMIGEDHGIAENPKLAAQLFSALASSGYEKAVVEISPAMARHVDAALAAGGLAALRAMFADPGSQVAFFGMAEEAAWLAAARTAAPKGRPFLWGLDYEIGGDRRLIADLKARPKPAAAARALAALEAASNASWAKYAQTRAPQDIYSFAGDPALVRAVHAAWPSPDADAAEALATLEATFRINRAWMEGQGYESNRLRAETMRTNLLRYWRAEKASGRAPKAMFKFGSNHMERGRTGTNVYDAGSLVHEIAALEGGHAFSMLVVAGKGARTAVFDPAAWTYRPQAETGRETLGVAGLAEAAFPDAFTLIDMRPLRSIMGVNRSRIAGPDLPRAIHSFDVLLVLNGSTPSGNL